MFLHIRLKGVCDGIYLLFCINMLVTDVFGLEPSDTVSQIHQDSLQQAATETEKTAQPPVDDFDNLEKMVVTGHRLSKNRTSVSTITSDEFKGRYSDLPSVLEQLSGVTARKTGGLGEYADVSIRGSSPKQVQVFLDGIPLNSASGDAADLSKIALNSLEEITVYKGSAPLELLGNSAGGVINLRTNGGNKDLFSTVTEIGSFGTRKVGLLGRKNSTRILNQFSVDYMNAQNDYPYQFDNGTPYNKTDDFWKRKENNEFSSISITGSNSFIVSESNRLISYVSGAINQNSFEQIETSRATLDEKSIAGYIRWEHNLHGEDYYGLRVDGRLKRQLFKSTSGFYIGGGERKVIEQFPYFSGKIDGSINLSDHITAQAVLRATYEGYITENLLSSATFYPQAFRYQIAGAAELEIKNETSTLALRYSHLYGIDSANFTPNHGLGISMPNSFTSTYPNANIDYVHSINSQVKFDLALRYEHLPLTLSDRYGWGTNFHGNDKLRPEKRSEFSVGSSLQLANINNSIAIFGGSVQDQIEIQQSQYVIQAVNNGNAYLAGLEWDFGVRLFQHFSVDNHFTYIYKKSFTKTPLRYSPIKYEVSVTLSSRLANAGHSVIYTSPYLVGYSNDISNIIAPIPVLNGYITIHAFDWFTLTYRVDNYLDDNYLDIRIESMFGTAPLPGRAHYLTWQFKF